MSLRPAPWPIFGNGASRRAAAEPGGRRAGAKRPDLKLVEGGASPRLERLAPRARLVGLIGMVAVVLFGVVAFHVVLSQGQFQLDRLQAKADQQQDRYERLRLEVAQLESPQRITSEAQNRLGMVTPDKVTPVAPNAADMPAGTVTQAGPAAPPTTNDPGSWDAVKPYLNPAAK